MLLLFLMQAKAVLQLKTLDIFTCFGSSSSSHPTCMSLDPVHFYDTN